MCTEFLFYDLTFTYISLYRPKYPLTAISLPHFPSHYLNIQVNIQVITFKCDAQFWHLYCEWSKKKKKKSCTKIKMHTNRLLIIRQLLKYCISKRTYYGLFIALMCKMEMRGKWALEIVVRRIIRLCLGILTISSLGRASQTKT